MSSTVTWLSPAAATRATAPVRAVRRAMLPSLRTMWQAIATRRLLADMDDRMLADIGLSRSDAAMETDRRPWDLGLR